MVLTAYIVWRRMLKNSYKEIMTSTTTSKDDLRTLMDYRTGDLMKEK